MSGDGTPERIRQSTLSQFASCALAGKLDAEYGGSSHRAGGGTIFHRAVAKCLETMVAIEEPGLDVKTALDIYDEVATQRDVPMRSDDPLADVDVVLSPREWKDMRAALISWTINLRWDVAHIVSIEERYDFPVTYLADDGAAVIRIVTTQLDMLQIWGDYAEGHDWKTSWRPPDKTVEKPDALDDRHADTDEEAYFQQVVHAVAVFLEFPRVQRYRAVEFYVRHAAGRSIDPERRAKAKEDPVRDALFHRHQLPELLAFVASYVERYDKARAADVWEPTGGTHCHYCPRPVKCTLFPAAKAGGVVTTQDEATAVLQQIEFLKGLLKDRQDAVKAWSEREGGSAPVRTPKGLDKVYGPVIRETTKRPSKAELEKAIANGVDPLSLYETTSRVEVTLHKPSEKHPHDVLAEMDPAVLIEREEATPF